MAHYLGVSRSEMLLRHMDDPCPFGFVQAIWRRMTHEPVAYIVGETEFLGLPFRVGRGVLIPRGDSEVLVETALEISTEVGTVLDLGTGSGALLLAFLSQRPGWRGVGADASSDALDYASHNGEALGLADRVEWVRTDWHTKGWTDGAPQFDLILCNPPYVETSAELDPDVRDFEPASALFSGEEGLDDYRAIIPQLGKLLLPGGVVVLEIGHQQAESVGEIAREAGFALELRRDLGERPRALILT